MSAPAKTRSVVTGPQQGRVSSTEVKDLRFTWNHFPIPNGPCFSKDGFLYIAEQNRGSAVFRLQNFSMKARMSQPSILVAQARLIPGRTRKGFNHTLAFASLAGRQDLYLAGQADSTLPRLENI